MVIGAGVQLFPDVAIFGLVLLAQEQWPGDGDDHQVQDALPLEVGALRLVVDIVDAGAGVAVGAVLLGSRGPAGLVHWRPAGHAPSGAVLPTSSRQPGIRRPGS